MLSERFRAFSCIFPTTSKVEWMCVQGGPSLVRRALVVDTAHFDALEACYEHFHAFSRQHPKSSGGVSKEVLLSLEEHWSWTLLILMLSERVTSIFMLFTDNIQGRVEVCPRRSFSSEESTDRGHCSF